MSTQVVDTPAGLLEPLHDRIVVKRDAATEETAGGLVKPEVAKEKPLLGTVLAIGSGRINADGSVKSLVVNVGERLLFGAYSGLDIPKELGLGEDLLILREDEILARVR